jgi:hypothetical protein
MIARLLARFRRPAHIGWGGDPINPFETCWNPTGMEIR